MARLKNLITMKNIVVKVAGPGKERNKTQKWAFLGQ